MSDGRIIKGNATKDKIILATIDIIADEGIKSLSAQKIAKKAGVSKSNIFHHFASVDLLPYESLKHITDMMLNSVQIGVFETTRDLLINLGQKTFSDDPRFVKMFKAFFSLYNESFNNPEYRLLLRNMYDVFALKICDEIKAIENIESDLSEFSQMLTIVIDGFGLHFMTEHKPIKYMDLWQIQVDMIIEKLKKYD